MAASRFEMDSHGVATLTIDTPGAAGNWLGKSFYEELAAALARVEAEPRIIGVVIASAKDGDFVKGRDPHEIIALQDMDLTVAQAARYVHGTSDLLRRMERCGKPFAAAINGPALGAGLTVALACHYRVLCNTRGPLLGLPEVTRGLLPGGGSTQRLPRLIGIERSLALLIEGISIDADEALRLGVVGDLAPCADVVGAARRWVMAHPGSRQPWDEAGFQIPGGLVTDGEPLRSVYADTAAALARRAPQSGPAPLTILRCIGEGTAVPMDSALQLESNYAGDLLLHPSARERMRQYLTALQAQGLLA